MLPIYLLMPIIAAMLIIALPGSRKYASAIAVLGSLASLAIFPFISYGSSAMDWFSVGPFMFTITTLVTPLSFMLLGVILFISPLIYIYSSWYMELPSEQRRFYIEILSFEAAMLAFSMSGGFILFIIAWEFLSLTSYLLIGFWNTREGPVAAARKSLTIVLIGDIAILAAIGVLGSAFGTLDFAPIMNGLSSAPAGAITIAAVLLALAAFTKSAQFPFQEWLIAAMEGPTPVSAFLHSTTMVKAGIFAILILLPLFQYAKLTYLLLAFGIITAVIATLNAAREFHIKKVIAYSTIQELSLMLIAISSGAVVAGVYFFFVQSFYKAMLFFSAGAAMKATGSEDIRKANGIRSNKLLYYSTLIGVLSLAGFIPFSGFFANVGISSSLAANLPVYVILSVISFGTSFYIFRWLFYISAESNDTGIETNYRAAAKRMLFPILLLAAATLAASAAFFYLPGFLSSSSYYNIAGSGLSLRFDSYDALSYTVLISIAAAACYMIYVKKRVRANTRLAGFGYTAGAFNSFYTRFSRFVLEMAEGTNIFDSYVSDFFDGLGRMTVRSGYVIRRASGGQINYYAAFFALALLLFIAYAML